MTDISATPTGPPYRLIMACQWCKKQYAEKPTDRREDHDQTSHGNCAWCCVKCGTTSKAPRHFYCTACEKSLNVQRFRSAAEILQRTPENYRRGQ